MTRARIPNRRRLAAVAAVAVVATLLSGCVSWFFPPAPSTTSTPTGEQVDAVLQPFYSQTLIWSSCGDGMQCTTAEAPMNWDDPAQATIELALVRQPATGDKKGSLLINPGGPGRIGLRLRARQRGLRDEPAAAAELRHRRVRPPRRRPLVGGRLLRRPGVPGRLHLRHHPGRVRIGRVAGERLGDRRRSSAQRASTTPVRCCSTSTPSARPAISTCCVRSSGTTS